MTAAVAERVTALHHARVSALLKAIGQRLRHACRVKPDEYQPYGFEPIDWASAKILSLRNNPFHAISVTFVKLKNGRMRARSHNFRYEDEFDVVTTTTQARHLWRELQAVGLQQTEYQS